MAERGHSPRLMHRILSNKVYISKDYQSIYCVPGSFLIKMGAANAAIWLAHMCHMCHVVWWREAIIAPLFHQYQKGDKNDNIFNYTCYVLEKSPPLPNLSIMDATAASMNHIHKSITRPPTPSQTAGHLPQPTMCNYRLIQLLLMSVVAPPTPTLRWWLYCMKFNSV